MKLFFKWSAILNKFFCKDYKTHIGSYSYVKALSKQYFDSPSFFLSFFFYSFHSWAKFFNWFLYQYQVIRTDISNRVFFLLQTAFQIFLSRFWSKQSPSKNKHVNLHQVRMEAILGVMGSFQFCFKKILYKVGSMRWR